MVGRLGSAWAVGFVTERASGRTVSASADTRPMLTVAYVSAGSGVGHQPSG